MQFELKEEHIKLLRHSNIRWNACELGAPCIDPKRPYGSSGVLKDIANILGEELDDKDDNQRRRLLRLHGETTTAMEIVLHTGSFDLGVYILHHPNQQSWQPIDSQPGTIKVRKDSNGEWRAWVPTSAAKTLGDVTHLGDRVRIGGMIFSDRNACRVEEVVSSPGIPCKVEGLEAAREALMGARNALKILRSSGSDLIERISKALKEISR